VSLQTAELRAAYPFILHDEKTRFDAQLMERVTIADTPVLVNKRECAKCGGPRHSLDTTGLCKKCKVDTGLRPASYLKKRHGAQEDREWEAKRAALAAPQLKDGEMIVEASLIDAMWGKLSASPRYRALLEVWPTLPQDLRVRLLKLALADEGDAPPAPAPANPVEMPARP
jgi:hypothetical protein